MTTFTTALPRLRPSKRPLFGKLVSTLMDWDAHYRSLRAMQRLDARLLQDVGLNRNDAPEWDAPVVMRGRR